MFSIRQLLSMVLLMAVSNRIANAFKVSSSRWLRVSTLSASTDATPAAGVKINNKIDLESPKVVSAITLNAGEKCVVCRCWMSNTFPLCDGTHAKHNKATGDNLGPAIISMAKAEA